MPNTNEIDKYDAKANKFSSEKNDMQGGEKGSASRGRSSGQGGGKREDGKDEDGNEGKDLLRRIYAIPASSLAWSVKYAYLAYSRAFPNVSHSVSYFLY